MSKLIGHITADFMTTVLCSCLRFCDVLGEGKLRQDALVCTEGQEVDLRFSRFNTTGNGFHLQPCTSSFTTNVTQWW